MNIKTALSLFMFLIMQVNIHTCCNQPFPDIQNQASESCAWQLNLVPAALFIGTVAYALGGWIYRYVCTQKIKSCRRETQGIVTRAQKHNQLIDILTDHNITEKSTESELITAAEHLCNRANHFSLYEIEIMLTSTKLQYKMTQEWHQFALEKDWINQQMTTALQNDIHTLYRQARTLKGLLSKIKPHQPFFVLYFELQYLEERYQNELNIFTSEQHQFSKAQLTSIIDIQASTHYRVKYPLLTYAHQLQQTLRNLKPLQKKATDYTQTKQEALKIEQNLSYIWGIIQQNPLYAQQIQQRNDDRHFEALQMKLQDIEQNQQYLMMQNELHNMSRDSKSILILS